MTSKRASANSTNSRTSRKKPRKLRLKPQPGSAWDPALLLIVLSAICVAWCGWKGWTLYYGDAEAHLNIARRVLDSRTPGYEQLGTVWLPLPHILMLPLAANRFLWRSGLAGAIPAAGAFVIAAVFLFLAARRAFNSAVAGWVAMFVFALNPNLLYLQSTPMTEPLSFACLCGLLYYTVRFGESKTVHDAALAGVLALLGTLTRYEGWFVLPLAAFYLALSGRWRAVVVFCCISALGPLYWIAHNWWYYGNPLEFYNGYYSAKQIYQRALAGGGFRYPGDGDWGKAWLYYRTAAELCAGSPLLWIGGIGTLVALVRRAWWPVILLVSLPVFYILSMHGSGTPIFVPTLWPNTYYNTRYGLSALPLLAFGAAACANVPALKWIATLIVPAVVIPWIAYPHPNNWICWKESQVNSEVRRAWTGDAANFLSRRYRNGDGIVTSFGDLSGILRRANIPFNQALHEGNGPLYRSALHRPDLFLWEDWGIAIEGDPLSTMLKQQTRKKPRFELVYSYPRPKEPAIEIYRRLR